jgi:uncharacterized membrane protein
MPQTRLLCIDALRGLAVVWMTVFHFCFDLNQFAYIKENFYTDSFWTLQRTAIVSLFLFCAGVGQAIAAKNVAENAQTASRFWRRWLQIAGAALLVTVGSYLMYPQSFIYFGVLHGIALMLIIARYTAAWGLWLWPAAALAIGLKFIAAWLHTLDLAIDFLNQPAFNWLGLISRLPVTEDYVPLFPWLGAMWIGMAAGFWLVRRQPKWAVMPLPAISLPLVWLGRQSLSWYLLHQPVMIGLLMLVGYIKAMG